MITVFIHCLVVSGPQLDVLRCLAVLLKCFFSLFADEFPSYIMTALQQNLPQFYNQFLTEMEASYATSRAVTMETDDATYEPDAACPYPLRTDLGSGFALERLGPTLCKVNNRFTGVYPGDGRRFVIDVGIDWGRWWVGITIVITF